eukprot:gb/GEZN01007955.1/.p1 GENE.gb/GEZN01007955.1/~~gb/GEZN01007955.1/.p1  ORF type:complete len:430 (-),score=69.70 gb/GEZN01007955.1/:194-1462(-)
MLSRNVSPDPIAEAIKAIIQFLETQNLEVTVETLKQESKVRLDGGGSPTEANTLLKALALYKEAKYTEKAQSAQETLAADCLADALQKLQCISEQYADRLHHSFEELHVSNIIALKVLKTQGLNVFASGSADKCVNIVDFKEKRVLKKISSFPAPVLTLCWNTQPTQILAVACMNGSIHVVDASATSDTNGSVIQSLHEHKKYVVALAWSPDGKYLASGSHDQTVRVYGWDPKTKRLTFTKEFLFANQVESLLWHQKKLLVAVRADNCLHLIDADVFTMKKHFNLNARGDSHVSFSALALAGSPKEDFLLVSTDNHRIIMLDAKSGHQVRNFYGAKNDEYSNPAIAWSKDGRYIYSSSQDNLIYCWDAASEKVVATLKGHDRQVRDLDFDPSSQSLISCGFDRSVKIWTGPTPGQSTIKNST